jgi:hypothetical protein
VTAVGPNGQSRTLGKGAQIEQGDTVNTNGGRAQLRFTDGAYVSLQPQSQFRIDQYRFDGKTDGNEKGFFSLLKGGLRTITGLVGRSNKANYQVSTAVATIGIRGTEYTIQYGQSITGTVGEGEINVCNGAGCLSVTNGESYYVRGQEIKPVLTNKRTDLPPPEPTRPPSNFAQGNNVDASGNPLPGFVLSGTRTLDFASSLCFSLNCSFLASFGFGGVMVFDATGNLQSFNGQPVSNVHTDGNDGIIAWGTFEAPNLVGSITTINHFVTGLTTDVTNLVANKVTATYTVIGNTTPTNPNSGATGTLLRADLTANFGLQSVDASISVLMGGLTMTANHPGMFMNVVSGSGAAAFSGSIFGTGSGAGSCAVAGGGSCSSGIAGFFSGPNAIRAGLVYDISIPGINSARALGAVAFTKN